MNTDYLFCRSSVRDGVGYCTSVMRRVRQDEVWGGVLYPLSGEGRTCLEL